MRSLTAALITELGLTVTRPGYLLKLTFSDTSVIHYSSMGDVTWNSLSWVGKDVRVRVPRMDGRVGSTVDVTIGNDAQSMTSLILNNGIAGKALQVWAAYRGALAAADPYLIFDGSASDATITPDAVTIKGMVEDMKYVICPRKRINKSTGFNALIPDGSHITVGSQTILIKRR